MASTIRGARSSLRKTAITALVGLGTVLAGSASFAANYCPAVWKQGVLPLNFNPAFTSIDKFNTPWGPQEDLLVSSFYNVLKDPSGNTVTSYFERDLVARIPGVAGLNPPTFDPDIEVEVLTDLAGPPNLNNWTNNVVRVPDGVLPFEAVIMPQGFHVAEPPGRLTLINLDSPTRQEYIVAQSTGLPPAPDSFCDDTGTTNNPQFYHEVRFVDMDGDGLQDVVTVRSNFKVLGAGSFCFFAGQLVYFKNPGAAISPATPWEEHLLYGGPIGLGTGPDVAIDIYDFEGDGVPEVVASHFFNRNGAIRIYGAPAGQNWNAVDAVNGPYVRQANIAGNPGLATDLGLPFGIQIVDLNLDGKMDLLTTNHQRDNCFDVTQSVVPGRVVAYEQPASGNVFGGGWIRHALKDEIRPNPTFPVPTMAPGRLAPGLAKAFTTVRGLQGKTKPWIVVGGDEASKVWLLTPKSPSKTNWDYQSAVIFDINDYYGPQTTQTIMGPGGISPGEVISTIGTPSVRYDSPAPTGQAQIYIPVFEAKAIHIVGFRPGKTPTGSSARRMSGRPVRFRKGNDARKVRLAHRVRLPDSPGVPRGPGRPGARPAHARARRAARLPQRLGAGPGGRRRAIARIADAAVLRGGAHLAGAPRRLGAGLPDPQCRPRSQDRRARWTTSATAA